MKNILFALLCFISLTAFSQTEYNGYYIKTDGSYVPAKIKINLDGNGQTDLNKVHNGLEVTDSSGTHILQPAAILEFGFRSDFEKHRYLSKPIADKKLGFVEPVTKGSKLALYTFNNLSPFAEVRVGRSSKMFYLGKQSFTIEKGDRFIFLTSKDTNKTCKEKLISLFPSDDDIKEFISSLFKKRSGAVIEIRSIIKVINEF